MQTLERFLEASGVAMRCRQVPVHKDRTPLLEESWARRRYFCELYGSGGDRPVTTIIGSDNGPPEITDVLDAVAAEAAVVEEAGGYERWAVEMGFDPDSRRGERIYRSIRRQATALRRLLGEERFEQLLWDTERL
jgi:hypothetical protein